MTYNVGNMVELCNGEHREIIGVSICYQTNEPCYYLDDDTVATTSDIDHVLSDEEIADLVSDKMSDI